MGSEFEEFLTEGMDAGAWLRVDPLRRLSTEEESLIATLLAYPFAGARQLQAQLPSVRVLFHSAGGDPGIKMSPSRQPSLAANVIDRVPVEARGNDAAGNEVTVLLHVVDRFLGELEIIGWDAKPVGLPSLEGLTVY